MRFETTPNYAVRKAVGQGAYGLVCSGRNVESGKTVAIKKIPKAFEDTIDCKRLLREIKILRHFRHGNVLGLVDILPPVGGMADWKDVVRGGTPKLPPRLCDTAARVPSAAAAAAAAAAALPPRCGRLSFPPRRLALLPARGAALFARSTSSPS